MVKRRDALRAMPALAVLATWPAYAQSGKTFRIGWLGSGVPPAPPTPNVSYEAFTQRLRELGYVEGRNLVIEQRYGHGRPDELAQRAAELARLPVDLILATTTTATAAAVKATQQIPIVMGSAANPLAAGLVKSLSRPGGNVTGLTLETGDTTAKRLELLKAALPATRNVAAFYPPEVASFPVITQWLEDTETAARQLGLRIRRVELPQTDQSRWDEVFRKTAQDGIRAAVIVETPTYLAQRARLAQLSQQHRIATIFPFREQAEAGGLLAYGAEVTDLYRRAADVVDKVLRGAKPAELPIEQPTKFTFVVNLKAAKGLGIKIPQSVLARADRIIQ